MERIRHYFPKLDEEVFAQFAALESLFVEWNVKINLISRKDIENFMTRHLLHSLAIYKYIQFSPGSRVLDLGTGGGLPGLPLAIVQPEVQYKLIDARAKKIMVVNNIIDRMELKNVTAEHIRVEDLRGKYDFVVSRAVAPMDKLYNWSSRLLLEYERNSIPNGLIALKGGNISEELRPLRPRTYTESVSIEEYFEESEFEGKYVVYAQR